MPTSLPLDIDVQVSVSVAQTEIATNMTLGCILTAQTAVSNPTGLVNFYSDYDSAVADFPTLAMAFEAFFAQPTHPETIAVGTLAMTATNAIITSGAIADSVPSGLTSITTGTLSFQCGTTVTSLTGLDFGSCTTLTGTNATTSVLGVLNTADGAAWSYANRSLVRTSAAAGPTEIATFATGTVAALLNLTQATGATLVQGTTGFTAALANVQTQAIAAGNKIYGWCLDAAYRDTGTEQTDLANYCLGNLWTAAGFLCTNNVAGYSPTSTTDIGAVLFASGNNAVSVIFHDNAQFYPDVSYIALALGVNYQLDNSAITLKFKDLPGIDTVNLTETQLAVLKAKNINTFTFMGNSARTTREGVQSSPTWYTDEYVNLSNFRNDLQTAIYNVFLANPKVPYTVAGQMLLVDGASPICDLYTRNGVFADRQIDDPTSKTGYTVEPATTITPEPIWTATSSMRAARVAPPISILGYLSGAIHSVAVAVNCIQ